MKICVLMILLAVTLAAPKRVPFITTIITGWWPEPGSSDATPQGDDLEAFNQLLALPHNLVVYGPKSLGNYVAGKREKSKTQINEVPVKDLTESWYFKRAKELETQGQKMDWKDQSTSIVAYSRVFLMKWAMDADQFNSDEMVWVDHNAMADYAVSQILAKENLDTLMENFKHHFFLLTTPKNEQTHQFPNAAKTYFKTDFSTFVGSRIIGAKLDAIFTMNFIYEDLLRVVIQFDANLWSEEAVLSLMADRSPFLVSYLSADDIAPPPKRLLPTAEENFEEQKDQLESLEWWIAVCELGILILAALLAYEVVRFMQSVKKRFQPVMRDEELSSRE